MLRLVVLAYIVAAATAQSYYNCYSFVNRATVKDREFYLVAKPSSLSTARSCEFNAVSDLGAFFVEIVAFNVTSSTILTISSDGAVLFRGSSIPEYQTSITSPAKSLQIRLTVFGALSSASDVKLRIQAMKIHGCPPGWVSINGYCYGTSTTASNLNFVDAQKACNSMRSNLLQPPIHHTGSFGSFMNFLPRHMKSTYTWIGLTDGTSSGQYKHYWLNGDRHSDTSEISCASRGSYWSCLNYERCGTMSTTGSYIFSIFMDRCSARRPFACWAPPGGASSFFPIPKDIAALVSTSTSISTSYSWIWGLVVACLFFVGLVIVGVYSRSRARATTRGTADAATSVVVSAGRVSISAPTASGGYPAQPSLPPPPLPPPLPPMIEPPPYLSIDPPSYEAALRDGCTNAGFNK